MIRTITIPKGKHRAQWMLPRLFWNRRRLIRHVSFDFSCRYELPGNDQQDWNKLFGFGWWPAHHTNSARFAWRYNADKKKIELAAYVYQNKVRQMIELCDLIVTFTYRLELKSDGYGIYFKVVQQNNGFELCNWWMPHSCMSKVSYLLHPYFGSNTMSNCNRCTSTGSAAEIISFTRTSWAPVSSL